MTAVLAEHCAANVGHRFRIEFEKIPIPRFAHGCFPAQFVQFENKIAFRLFGHRSFHSALEAVSQLTPRINPSCSRVVLLQRLPQSFFGELVRPARDPDRTIHSRQTD